MINCDNYYQDIIGKINHLITANKWEQAMELIKTELAMPYVPISYETILQELQSHIINNMKAQKSLVMWNLDKIAAVLVNENDEMLHPIAFYYLQNYNVRLILPVIKVYLANNKMSNINKTQLLLLLSNQGITDQLTVVKNNVTWDLQPHKLLWWNNSALYREVKTLLTDNVHIDNPGLYSICLFLCDNFMESIYPSLPLVKDAAPLAAALYITACQLQTIRVTLTASSKQFKTSITLIKKYLTMITNEKIT